MQKMKLKKAKKSLPKFTTNNGTSDINGAQVDDSIRPTGGNE